MNPMYKVYCRTVQAAFRVGIAVLPWRTPELLKGEGKIKELPAFIKTKNINRVLVVTDGTLKKIGMLDSFFAECGNAGLEYFVYDETVPNPTIDNIEAGLKIYKENDCQGIVAFGGGSPMDCAKGIGARVVKPNKPVSKMKGYFKILKKLPPLFAVPTTAGTGSETTVAAVITDSRTHDKYPISDISLMPHYAVLDPELTVNLPKHITSTTGVDALTHAVEGYIGKSNSDFTIDMSLRATLLIFENLKKAYDNGKDMEARANMQMAAFYAGAAFTRSFVGYVHAIAHTLGGLYGTPHGLANAVILPYVLDWYGSAVYAPLSELAELTGVCSHSEEPAVKAKKFIAAIRELNAAMDIPDKLKALDRKDFDHIAKRALKEGNPIYPVPKIMDKEDVFTILDKLVIEA